MLDPSRWFWLQLLNGIALVSFDSLVLHGRLCLHIVSIVILLSFLALGLGPAKTGLQVLLDFRKSITRPVMILILLLLILAVIVTKFNDHFVILIVHIINNILLLAPLIVPSSSRIILTFMLLKHSLRPLSHLLLIGLLYAFLDHVEGRLILIGSRSSR